MMMILMMLMVASLQAHLKNQMVITMMVASLKAHLKKHRRRL